MQAGKAPSSMGSSTNGSRERRLKCMYTTQLTKKRKTWSDGLLKVFFSGGSFQCSLLDAGKLRETVLVSRQLESLEVQQLKKNEEIELDFEGYLVTVSAGTSEHDESKVGPPLKLPKFIPPSRYVPPVRQVDRSSGGNINTVGAVSGIIRSAGAAGPYKVTNDELDDIWDRDQPPQTHRTAPNVQFAADAEPPAFLMYSAEQTGTRPSHQLPPRFGQQAPAAGPAPAAPRPSVEVSLRLTGANAGGDASQPALTRYFAAVPPWTQAHAQPAVHQQPLRQHAPPAQPAYATDYNHTRTNYGESTIQSGFHNSSIKRGNNAPTSAAPPPSSAAPGRSDSHNFAPNQHSQHSQYSQHLGTASNIPRGEFAVPDSFATKNRAADQSSTGGTFATSLAPPRAPAFPSADEINANSAMNSFAPVASTLKPPSAVHAIAGASAGPAKSSYSSIISSSVWDSD